MLVEPAEAPFVASDQSLSNGARFAATPIAREHALAGVLAEVMGVERVPLGSHFFDDLGADSMLMARFCARIRKRTDLPAVSMKDVYAHPTISALATALAPASGPAAGPAPAPVAAALATLLAEVMGVESVPLDGHVFDQLGADSMVMARFCARVRKRDDLPTVSMKDIYAHPTITSLAAAFAPASAPAAAPETGASADSPDRPVIATSIAQVAGTVRSARHRRMPAASRPRYVLCGVLQLLFLLGYPSLVAFAAISGYDWMADSSNLVDLYLRSVLVGSAMFVGMCALPVLAKWVLIGRWTPRQIQVWSMAYLRFWMVKTLVQRNPMALFVGSPLYAVYLRALGAKVGRRVVILSRNVPVCTDLLTIGDDTVIRKDSFFTGYRAHSGVIQTGAVTIGRNVLVGEQTVLDIETSLGDGAQLGHASSLHPGQVVPAGRRWHGSPAQPTQVDYRAVATTAISTLRRVAFSTVQLLNLLVLGLPLATGGVLMLLLELPQVAALLDPGPLAFTTWSFFVFVLVTSSVLFFGAVLAGLVFVTMIPRMLGRLIKRDTVYPLYGFHYWVHRLIARTTNRKFFTQLFGDSSFIVYYLQALGYDLGRVEQTGSNFGTDVKHESPTLSAVGRGTMVADGLSFANADFSSTSFRVSQVSVGAHSFVGNNIVYPAQGKTGDNCLLATKVLVPIDGPVRDGVGLLGSPSFEIPRSVARDVDLGLGNADERRRRLAAKARHNLVTMALYLLVRWGYVTLLALVAAAAADLHHASGALVVAVAVNAAVLLVGVPYLVLVERGVTGLEALRPMGCSIYDRAFWRHERYWKVPVRTYLLMFNGTPMKNVLARLLGVRIGRRVFDDGCIYVEKRFVTVGDECTLNAGSIVQGHSQEDGAFKSDLITIGAGCTLGVGAFVHYGVTLGDGAVLAADSFLMKGEEVPPQARWGGNPATEMREGPVDLLIQRISISDAGTALVRCQ
jgi:non-ribosomal peptide synthetase-like protein